MQTYQSDAQTDKNSNDIFQCYHVHKGRTNLCPGHWKLPSKELCHAFKLILTSRLQVCETILDCVSSLYNRHKKQQQRCPLHANWLTLTPQSLQSVGCLGTLDKHGTPGPHILERVHMLKMKWHVSKGCVWHCSTLTHLQSHMPSQKWVSSPQQTFCS